MGAKLQEATELVIFDLFNLLIRGTLVWATAGSAKTLANILPITVTMHYKRRTMPTSCRVYIAANTTSVPYS
jgi:hypothetical protein